jgi:hypothetical protein
MCHDDKQARNDSYEFNGMIFGRQALYFGHNAPSPL